MAKKAEKRLDRIVGAALDRRPVNIMDITKVYKVARENEALPDTDLLAKVIAFVESIKVAV